MAKAVSVATIGAASQQQTERVKVVATAGRVPSSDAAGPGHTDILQMGGGGTPAAPAPQPTPTQRPASSPKLPVDAWGQLIPDPAVLQRIVDSAEE